MHEKIKFYGKIIEFDEGSCERINLMIENVNKVNIELDKIQQDYDEDQDNKNETNDDGQ